MGVTSLIRNVGKLLSKSKGEKSRIQNNHQDSKPADILDANFNQNVETLRSVYDNCSDVMFRPFLLFGKTRAMLIYIEGLSDIEGMEEYVLSPLMQESTSVPRPLNEFLEHKMPVTKVKRVNMLADCIESISAGNPILLYEGEGDGFSLGLSKWEKRAIEEPVAEGGIRGSREGFNESLVVNTSQLRRIIKSPALKIQSMKIGKYTNTNVAIAYIEGLVDKSLIKEITVRLERIELDGILESGYIEEMIEDNPYSPFPQVMSTERPDVACSSLLEGRAVILVEGTPFTLIAPISFFSLIQSQEDYYQRFMVGTFIRWLRYFFIFLSLLLPSLYVAILTFHHEAVPTSLLLSMAASRESVPFPALVEALIMEITFEALREAGVRLPKQVGSAVSIVGALVIGQASVQAGLVSAPMVIVVAITGIASFMVPRYIAGIAIRMLRFPMMLLAGTLGLLGIMMGIIAIVIHLCSLRSFGVPYLTALGPVKGRELKDVLWRAPWWMMDTRPRLTGNADLYRQPPEQGPNPKGGSKKE
ncbi:spore germination protein [Peribacillus simplex]|uniref:spore germination protein n=1 Tax=Peribacillus simplex TaxID=1478 RepID=UPI000F630CE1|nr:spore germination protein [Peribacillus simplex]